MQWPVLIGPGDQGNGTERRGAVAPMTGLLKKSSDVRVTIL